MGYSKEWWAENRDRILARRAERYRTDPKVRAASAERTKRYREKKRAEAAKTAGMVEYRGELIQGHEIDAAAAMAGISRERLEYMQRARYIPTAPVNRPKRLWGAPHIAAIKRMDAWLRANESRFRALGPGEKATAAVVSELDALIEEVKTIWEG